MNDVLMRVWLRAYTTVSSLRDEHGQTATEYAIIVSVIAIGIFAAVGTLRDAVISALEGAAGDI